MALVIFAGFLLFAVFLLFGKLWSIQGADYVTAAKFFIPVWVLIALTNMWVGVSKAGYTIAQELPILAIVASIPIAAAFAVIWFTAKG